MEKTERGIRNEEARNIVWYAEKKAHIRLFFLSGLG
jgi:hypothetical protein